ncbi:hypothetical protein RD110_18770 [Rhodoferax koreense]|uniref:Uncharacterized protein n=1 Tax=Rhodoferax koreensis TaxID=1842727 RepID=A0A1P8JZ23_9BURK|nr:hypothetical protein [Rhodoferax koreense]APW38998.1 hypothetical protein RD110_18770 [Rhodoferax koreense]
MNGRRKPRQPRWAAKTPTRLVSMLTAQERIAEVAYALVGFKALRQGVATEVEWAAVVSVMNMADGFEVAINRSGARGHIQAAQLALDEIMRRAMESGEWLAVQVHSQEIEDIRTGIELYQARLRECTYAEYRRVQTYARAEVASGGGVVLAIVKPAREPAQQLLLEAL